MDGPLWTCINIGFPILHAQSTMRWNDFERCFQLALRSYIWDWHDQEPSCCKKQQKSPGQETGLGNRGRLKVLNDTKLILKDQRGHSITHAQLGSIWHRSEPLGVPNFPWNFVAASYSKIAIDLFPWHRINTTNCKKKMCFVKLGEMNISKALLCQLLCGSGYINPKDLIIAFILSFFKNNFSEIIPLHCYDGMHFSVSCSFVKKKYMASRFWIAYFLLSGSDENWSKASSILSTLPVLLFRPQKNKPLLIYPSRCLRDS